MKILVVHNYYRSAIPSGEATAFETEVRLLRNNGYHVIEYCKHNDDLDSRTVRSLLKASVQSVWSRRSYRELTRLIAGQRPDVAHFHNVFPQISASGYAACRRLGVPVVQTVHNYRMFCLNGLFQRDGMVCELCMGRSSWPGIRHRCYRGSLPASVVAALVRDSQRLLFRSAEQINLFIAMTDFAANKLVSGGIARERIVIKPSCLDNDAGFVDYAARGNFALFAGRLSAEKGAKTLVRAWSGMTNMPLLIAGDGPQRSELEVLVSALGANVHFLGMRTREDVLDLMGRAQFQIVPSELYEGFPLTLVEAFSRGTPVIASRIGALEQIVAGNGAGIVFAPGDSDALRAAMLGLANDEPARITYGMAARRAFVENYSAPAAITILSEIYQRVAGQ